MAIIECPNSGPLDPKGIMNVPATLIPSFRTFLAAQNKVEKNLLIHTRGGLGDFACAEPAIRYAIKTFKDSNVSVASTIPQLYRHLPLKRLYDTNIEKPDLSQYLSFQTLYDPTHLSSEFLAHICIHAVDYHSLNMFRCTMPNADKCITLVPTEEEYNKARALINPDKDVLIHAGKTWPSKTFPTAWWNRVISRIIEHGYRPVLLGATYRVGEELKGTVDTDSNGCLDLRNKLSIMETIAVTHVARVLLANDSGVTHCAASGDAWIGLISTVKHPDLLMHYRSGGICGHKTKNWSKGGMWETLNHCPNNAQGFDFSVVHENVLESWLPEPNEYADWGVQKCHM